jgi:hypothetical protein
MTEQPSPRHVAQTLAAFVDTLLPGDDVFPPASLAGAQELLADRLRERYGASAVFGLVKRLDEFCEDDQHFAQATPDQRVTVVRRLESEAPDLFAFVYAAACYAYYASPLVTAAIRTLGHEYNEAPQPDGYVLPAFDFTPGVNVPFAPKGTYKMTGTIERVDLSSLSALNLPVAGAEEEGA